MAPACTANLSLAIFCLRGLIHVFFFFDTAELPLWKTKPLQSCWIVNLCFVSPSRGDVLLSSRSLESERQACTNIYIQGLHLHHNLPIFKNALSELKNLNSITHLPPKKIKV